MSVKKFYTEVCLVVSVVNHFGEEAAAKPYAIVCGLGGFLSWPQDRDQREVMIEEYKANPRRRSSNSVA